MRFTKKHIDFLREQESLSFNELTEQVNNYFGRILTDEEKNKLFDALRLIAKDIEE